MATVQWSGSSGRDIHRRVFPGPRITSLAIYSQSLSRTIVARFTVMTPPFNSVRPPVFACFRAYPDMTWHCRNAFYIHRIPGTGGRIRGLKRFNIFYKAAQTRNYSVKAATPPYKARDK